MRNLFIVAVLTISTCCQAQLRINEVMASNVRSFPNAMDFEDYPDWLELYHSTTESRSLFGYYLSDDSENLQKWAFPEQARIEAGEHLVVVADGHDRAAGSRERRDYEGGSGFTTRFHHTNFKLSSEGEELLLSRETQTLVPLIHPQSTWRYLVPEDAPQPDWTAGSFDDSSWNSGVATFGYDAPFYRELGTEVDFGDTESDKHITTYLRHKFTLPDFERLLPAAFNFYQVNDGAVVYLNGAAPPGDHFFSGEVP